MHRTDLLRKLGRFRSSCAAEEQSRRRIVSFASAYADCFERSLSAGHITGSAWLISRDGRRALLTHHRKLDQWLQLGGHADGNADVLAVALREASEESGIGGIEPVSEEIFDVDVHRIPARGHVPEHLHYDVRFLLRATGNERYCVGDESHDLTWVCPRELTHLAVDESVLRMRSKWVALLRGSTTI